MIDDDADGGGYAADGCPVCTAPITQDVCPRCGWELFGGFRLGPVTADVVVAFERALAAARRRFDLLIAARCSGAPMVCPPALASLIRGGPPEQDEWVEACLAVPGGSGFGFGFGAGLGSGVGSGFGFGADGERSGGGLAGTSARALAEAAIRERGPVPLVQVAEVSWAGLTITAFEPAPDGQLWERAALSVRDWPELVPDLAFDADERRFQLAGGIGTRPPARVTTASWGAAVSQLLDPDGLLVVADRLGGVPLSEAVVEALRKAHPTISTADTDFTMNTDPTMNGLPAAVQLPGPFGAAAFSRFPGAGPLTLVAGRTDGTVAVHHLSGSSGLSGAAAATAAATAHPDPHAAAVTAVAVSDDGTVIVSGGADGAVTIGGASSTVPSRRLTVHDGRIRSLLIRAGTVFSLGVDGTVGRTPLDGSAALPPLAVGRDHSTAFAVSDDGAELAAGGTGAQTAHWDCASATRTATAPFGAPVTALAFEPGARTLVAGAEDGSVRRLTADRTRWTPLIGPGGPPIRLLAAPDDGSLVLADAAGRLRRFTDRASATDGAPATGAPTAVGIHAAPVLAAAIAGDGRLVTLGADGQVRWWPVEPGPLAFIVTEA